MPDRPDVVLLVDPLGRPPVVRVTGPLEDEDAAVLQEVVRRAVTAVGPRVTVDLSGCTGLAASVAACLVDEHERLRARGGALVVEGVPPVLPAPAGPPAPDDGASRPPSGLTDDELAARLRSALLRRLRADAEPERTAAGRRLLALLHERDRRGGSRAPGPDVGAAGSTWNTSAASLVDDPHEHP